MTGKELAAYIGKMGHFHTSSGMSVAVTIVDARMTYGNLQVRVEPIAGKGAAWLMITSVEVED